MLLHSVIRLFNGISFQMQKTTAGTQEAQVTNPGVTPRIPTKNGNIVMYANVIKVLMIFSRCSLRMCLAGLRSSVEGQNVF